MTTPQVGVTHDIVIHVNDTMMCGLIVKPYTYAVNHIPTFINRLSVGDPTGLDTTRWRSFVQQSFYLGAGQYVWSSPHANGGYAESVLFDIGMPTTVAGAIVRDDPGWAFGQNQTPQGHAIVAIIPSAMTGETGIASLFTAEWPIFVVEMSGNPHVVHGVSLITYTNHPGGGTWASKLTGTASDALKGIWSKVTDFSGLTSPVVSAVQFSNTLIAALNNGQIRNFGPACFTIGGVLSATNFCSTYVPSYNTLATRLSVYDNKLWRTNGAKVAYLQPSITTDPWSAYYDLGYQDHPVLATKEFSGKLFFGKEDSLWVFDAGQTYMVQDFSQEISTSNFGLMCEHRGFLYFNIGPNLYRYSSAGLIEKIRTPFFDGPILSGVSCRDELLFVVRNGTEDIRAPQTWIYDSETGGVRMWLEDVRSVTADALLAANNSPSNISALRGNVFISPMYMTGTAAPFVTNKAPIVTATRSALVSGRTFEGAQLITSSFDFGLPSLEKMYGALKIDVKMDENSYMDVYISTDPTQLARLLDRPEDLWCYRDSVGGYLSATATSLNIGNNLAYCLDSPYATLKIAGGRFIGATTFSIAPRVEYTKNNDWYVAPSTIETHLVDNTSAYEVSLNLSLLSGWVAQLVAGELLRNQYGLRFGQIAIVPLSSTLVLNTTDMEAHSTRGLIVDGTLVLSTGVLEV